MAKAPSCLPTAKGLLKRKWHWEDDAFAERCPSLYEFLCTAMVDGEDRKGGSISLFCSNGQLKVCFLDKQTQLAFYGVLDGSGELYAVLEELLAGGHEPWAPTKRNPGQAPF